jgi:hypothetical protein
MPPEITKFSDIKLRDFSKKSTCQGANPILKNKYTINKKEKLFVDYADNIRKMIQTASENQSKLLAVINDLFTYVIDPYSGKKVIRVNPKLTDELLQKAIEKTRRFIVDLYINCENDYVNGVKLYEAIVESKILETTQKQIETLKTEASKIIQETKKTSPQVAAPVVAPVVIAEGQYPSNTTTTTPISTQNTSSLTSSTVPYSLTPNISSTYSTSPTTNINTTPSSSSVSGVTQLATSSLPSTKNM